MGKYSIFVFWAHLPWAADSADLTPSPSALTFSASSAAWAHQRAAVIGLQVPHTLHSGGNWCPALWHRDRTCPGQLASHTGLVPPKVGQGGGILNPNVWWELVNWFCKLLVRDQQTHPRLPFATFIWQNTEISLQLCQLLANTAGATLKCGQMCFAASYPLYSFFSEIILLHEADTLGCLKLPSKGSMEAFPLQFWGSFSCRALQCLAPWVLHLVTCVWRSSKACYCDGKYWIAWGIEVVSLQ